MSVLDNYVPEKGDRVRIKAKDHKDREGEIIGIDWSSYFVDWIYTVHIPGKRLDQGYLNHELEKI